MGGKGRYMDYGEGRYLYDSPDFVECHTHNAFTFHHSIRRKSCNSELQNRNDSGLCLLRMNTIFRSHSYNVLWEISRNSNVHAFISTLFNGMKHAHKDVLNFIPG